MCSAKRGGGGKILMAKIRIVGPKRFVDIPLAPLLHRETFLTYSLLFTPDAFIYIVYLTH